MLENKDISIIRWAPVKTQVTDCLTKKGADSKKLIETITNEKNLR